jgi:hypothetical protein
MVIDNFDLVRIRVLPDETDAPLVINADTVLSGSFAFQAFEPISRRHPQILKTFRAVKTEQLAQGSPLNV